jgi:hypothetical protein
MTKKIVCVLLLAASLCFGRYCLSFDGSNDYIDVMDSLKVDCYTWQCLFYPETFTPVEQCLAYFGFSPYEFCLISSDSTVGFTTVDSVTVHSGPIIPGRWYHMAVVREAEIESIYLSNKCDLRDEMDLIKKVEYNYINIK